MMKVWKMNDYEWVAANSPGEALKAYAEWTGCESLYELVYQSMVDNEITECPLDEEMFVDLQEKDLGKTTFGAVIAGHLQSGDERPFLIASTEY